MDTTSIEKFYQQMASSLNSDVNAILPKDILKEIGHFNVFNLEELIARSEGKNTMPYDRRTYYKISLIKGRNRAEYSDKVIEIENNALLFATPKIPYNWIPKDLNQSGYFCIFTDEFLVSGKSGIQLDELPIFKPGGYPIFEITDQEAEELTYIFKNMQKEIASEYVHKYDLIRNYVMELIHFGQKLQPAAALYQTHNASSRVASLFLELLERQFPISSSRQKLSLRTAKDYADRLSVHVNHLNKVLKENTGKTTTELINNRVLQEAKILLKQTDWSVSEVAFTLGFEEVAHFSNFFKKQTTFSPVHFRS
ncbi:helix-turn-helix transcriptional regulator [uncultured Bacteroides sp.]|uniref:helix-turn-helix domain-containing protein n=1 Tax=uncultured Bacteroides sp. TaxID=162156 RepID=UPI002AA82FFE|nr:helix-turn-helix transcriptional regulator [uncultured Bacteroides sp.]